MLAPSDILGPQDRIAARLERYEHRPQQIEMAEAVYAALEKKQHLVVEAGTGVGKSFGYLVPAILAATANQDPQQSDTPRRTIVVSTHTISLQEQIVNKDIPFLRSVIPREFAAVLVKGRGNYLSKRRLATAYKRRDSLWSESEPIDELASIHAWADDSTDGSLAELSFRPRPAVWDEVASDRSNCLGRTCPTHENCFYFKARRRSQNAQILIVNHALFFSDLALRGTGGRLLPDYDAVIFDEAHTMEAVAGDHLGLGITSGQLEFTLNRLFNDRNNKGLLVDRDLTRAQREVMHCYQVASEFFSDVHGWYDELQNDPARRNSFNGRVHHPQTFETQLCHALKSLSETVRRIGSEIKDESERLDFISSADRLLGISEATHAWLAQEDREAVYWVEASWGRHDQSRVHLASAPIDVGPSLREKLFQSTDSVILTSATLSTNESGNFSYFRSRIGLSSGVELRVGSPFNYREQASIVLVDDMPDPAMKPREFATATTRAVKHFVAQTDGRAFVLFTSYELMRQVGTGISYWLGEQNLALFTQAAGVPRSQMLEQFKRNPRSLLFGTDSFWQGVDVPGDALQLVIIPKLPFSVPDQPLIQARLEAIRARGGNPFQEFQLPSAIIKLRQGFGRLIRTQTDHGRVVILDPRMQTKSYGRQFLAALPDCRVERVKLP